MIGAENAKIKSAGKRAETHASPINQTTLTSLLLFFKTLSLLVFASVGIMTASGVNVILKKVK
jgi:hypothetical protein